jgi:hypothetical protein
VRTRTRAGSTSDYQTEGVADLIRENRETDLAFEKGQRQRATFILYLRISIKLLADAYGRSTA